MLSLLKHELFSRWGAVLGWSAALTLFGVMYVLIYPDFEDKMSAFADIPIYKSMGYDLSSFEGFIASSLILNIPVILAIYVIMSSTATIAGEDDTLTLELLATTPLKRWHILTMKTIALLIVTLIIIVIAGACSALALTSIRDTVSVQVTSTQLFLAVLSGWPLIIATLMIGIFFSAFMPNRRTAAIATTTVFLFGYLGELMVMNVETLNFIKPALLFTYFDSAATVFTKGVQPSDVAILLTIATIAYLAALLSFQHRDLTTAQWPWQRIQAKQSVK